MLDYYLQYIESRSADYIAHHGVEGMTWGKRNGPPYPLDGSGKAALKKQKVEKKKAEKLAKKKAAIAKDPVRLQKNLDLYTPEELGEILKKYEVIKQLRNVPTQKELYDRSKMAKVMLMGNEISTLAANGTKAFVNVVNIKRGFDGKDPISLNGGGGKKNK